MNSSDKLSVNDKLRTIKSVISEDILGNDMKISLFVSSAITYRYDSCLVPFPAEFKTAHGEKDITRVTHAIENIPNLLYVTKTPETELKAILNDDTINLLYWLLVEIKGPQVKTVDKKDFDEVLSKIPQETSIKTPAHIFRIAYRPESSQEKAFQTHAKEFNTSFAYHGTKVFYLHNILHQGLQQHLSKNALFGDGLYLSSELNVSLPYSRNGIGWQKSVIGDVISCVALCEFVEHPVFSKHCLNKDKNTPKTELPEKYIIVSNNDCVRLRYLVVYASKSSPGGIRNEEHLSWTKYFNFRTLSVVYLMILVFVGMSDSPYMNYLKKNFLKKFQASMKFLLGRE